MKCTNYSVDPFKTISTTFNTAAADHVAAIIESSKFHQWLGTEKLPPVKDMKITAISGDVWDLRKSLNTWKKEEEIKEGFRNKNGDPILFDMNEEGVLSRLARRTEYYNTESNPFKARIVRTTVDDAAYYTITTEFNKAYKKSKRATIAERPVVDRVDPTSFFYLRHYDPSVFSEGKKTVSIRSDLFQEGVYNIGDEFFRVTLRSKQMMYVKDAKEGKAKLRKNFIQDDAIAFQHIQDFFDGKVPMFIYDIEKVDITPKEGMALPDFIGAMSIKVNKKAPGAKSLTGYTDIDKYIETLIEAKNNLYNQRAAVRKDMFKVQKIDNQIETLNGQIARLKEEAELTTLMSVGRQILNQLEKEKDALSFREIDNAMHLAKAWAELDKVVPFDKTDADEETLQILADAEQLRSAAQTMFTEFHKKYVNKLLDEVDEHISPRTQDGRKQKASRELTDEEGNIQFYDIDELGAWTIGKSFSANAIEQLLNHLTNEADFQAQEESYAFEQRLNEAVHDLLGTTAERSKPSDFDFLFQQDHYGNKVLVSKYDRNFYKQLYTNRYRTFEKKSGKKASKSDNYQAALALGATADELKEPMTQEEYYTWERQYMEYELTDEGQQAFEQFMNDVRDAHITGYNEDHTPIYDEAAIEDIRKEWDPEVFRKYINRESKKSNKGNKWFTKRVSNAPLNKAYVGMTVAQKKFYDFYTKEYVDGQQNLVMDHRFGDLDFDKELLDFVIGLRGDLKDKVKHLGKDLGDFMKGLTAVRYFDNPIALNTRSALTGKERKGPQFKTIDKFIPAGSEFKQPNPMEILTQFRRWGHLYKHKRQIEDKLNAIKDLSLTAKKVEHTNDGRVRFNAIGKVLATGEKTNLGARIAYNVDVALTDQRKTPHKVNSEGKPGEWKMSLGQTIDTINVYTRVKNMALSPMSATGNFVMGTVNNWIYASSGQYYSDKELAQAYWILKENFITSPFTGKLVSPTARKIAEIMRRYSVLGDVTEELYHESDLTSWLFKFQKNGEFMSQGATAIAQMLRQKVELKDGSKKSLFDMWELDKATNRVVFRKELLADKSEFQEDKALFSFFEKVKKVNMKIHGDYTNALMAKKDTWGRVLLMFRTWLPMAVKERFGKQYTDEHLGEQKGRYLSAWNVLAKAAKNRDLVSVGDFLKVLAKIGLPIIGRKIKFSDQLSEVDRNNLALFVREVQFIILITSAIAACKARVDDEDDEDAKNLLRWIYNQGERSQSELVFFFSPKDAMQITKDFIPLSQTLTEGVKVITRGVNYLFDPESDEYQRGVNKGKSKVGKAFHEFVPVWRQVEKTESAMKQIFSDSRYQ